MSNWTTDHIYKIIEEEFTLYKIPHTVKNISRISPLMLSNPKLMDLSAEEAIREIVKIMVQEDFNKKVDKFLNET